MTDKQMDGKIGRVTYKHQINYIPDGLDRRPMPGTGMGADEPPPPIKAAEQQDKE